MIEVRQVHSRRHTTAALEIGASRFPAFNRIVPEEGPVTAEMVAQLMVAVGLKERAIRTLAKCFQAKRSPESLAPSRRGPKPGSFQCSESMYAAIMTLAEELLITPHAPSEVEAVAEIRMQLFHPERGYGFSEIDIPDDRTIRRMLSRITRRTRAKPMGSKTKTANEPHPGHYNSDGPLDLVQMDHTKGDAILVDRVHRLVLGRPTITLLIDVFTRVILGWYVTFGDPSICRCGRAIVNALLPKEPLLEKLGLDISYPMHGSFSRLHADQAKPHRNEGFTRACLANGIDATVRKPGPAHHGGHIERLIGTMVGKMRLLPGSTGSNATKRDGYDAEAEAAMTLPEFERWLLLQIAIYHITPHNGLHDRTPAHAWAMATKDRTPLLSIDTDPERLVKQFMRSDEMFVKTSGVQKDYRRYWAPILAPYLGQIMTVYRDDASISQAYVEIDDQFHTLYPMGVEYPDISEAEWGADRDRYLAENKANQAGQYPEIAKYRHMARREVEQATELTKKSRAERKLKEAEGASHSVSNSKTARKCDGAAWLEPAALDIWEVSPRDD